MLSGLFFKEKPVRTLAALAEKDRIWYASMLCKKIDCTYPHMINTLGSFEKFGLISSEGSGRINIIKLTPQGEDLAHEFEGLLRRLDRVATPEEDVVEVDEFTSTRKDKKTAKKPEKARESKEKKEENLINEVTLQ